MFWLSQDVYSYVMCTHMLYVYYAWFREVFNKSYLRQIVLWSFLGGCHFQKPDSTFLSYSTIIGWSGSYVKLLQNIAYIGRNLKCFAQCNNFGLSRGFCSYFLPIVPAYFTRNRKNPVWPLPLECDCSLRWSARLEHRSITPSMRIPFRCLKVTFSVRIFSVILSGCCDPCCQECHRQQFHRPSHWGHVH